MTGRAPARSSCPRGTAAPSTPSASRSSKGARRRAAARRDRTACPAARPAGAGVLQPSDERGKPGSPYPPRALTEPIVRTTLKPLLDALRAGDKPPTPAQLLDLKVCDPAMGSAAFLVE